MRLNSNAIRPASLRQRHVVMAATLTAAAMAAPANAQAQAAPAPQDNQEVQLDTLKIHARTADVNPYAEEGAAYKARVSADSRHTKSLAETPQTITVITEAQIKESGRTDLKAILQQQPGVTVGTGENGNKFGDRYILRGQELKSDVFVDGLRDPGMTTRESFDVQQIELTKGPSSTFAGRGSAGGAVNAITKVATTDYNFVNTDVTGGTASYVRLTGDANLKVSDSFALRANGLYDSEDVPDRGPASRKRFGGALSAILKPAANFSVILDYYHLTAHDNPDLGSYFTGAGGTVVKNVPVYLQQGDFVRSNVNTLTARMKWEISPDVRLENIARSGLARNGYVTTGARGGTLFGTNTSVATIDNGHNGWQKIEYLADQLNLVADTNLAGMKHAFILGGEASHNRVVNGTYAITNAGAKNCATGANATLNSYCVLPSTANPSTVMGRSYFQGAWTTDWEVNTVSAYLMDTVDVAKWLTVFGGVRLDHYDFNLKTQTVSGTTGLATSAAPSVYAYSGNLWNYHAGVSLKPSDDGQFYFAFGTATNINGGESDVGTNCGYGGFCTVTGSNYFGQPVRTTNYEVGTKWELFNHKLLLTGAGFHLIKDGVFQSANGDSYSQTGSLNSGRYKVDGVEFGLVGNITSRLSGQAGATWMRSRILASVVPTEVGYKLSNFANFQATAQLRYQLTDAFALGATVNHKSSMATGQPDTAAVHTAAGIYSYNIPAYTTFDMFASYKLNSHLEARVNVQNVGNADYYLAGYRGGTFVYLGDKRRATFTLSGKF